MAEIFFFASGAFIVESLGGARRLSKGTLFFSLKGDREGGHLRFNNNVCTSQGKSASSSHYLLCHIMLSHNTPPKFN